MYVLFETKNVSVHCTKYAIRFKNNHYRCITPYWVNDDGFAKKKKKTNNAKISLMPHLFNKRALSTTRLCAPCVGRAAEN